MDFGKPNKEQKKLYINFNEYSYSIDRRIMPNNENICIALYRLQTSLPLFYIWTKQQQLKRKKQKIVKKGMKQNNSHQQLIELNWNQNIYEKNTRNKCSLNIHTSLYVYASLNMVWLLFSSPIIYSHTIDENVQVPNKR